MRLVNLQGIQGPIVFSVASAALLLVSQFLVPSFQAQLLTNIAMMRAVKTLLAPGDLDESQLDTARAELYQVMDTEEDPYTTLRRLREIES